MLVPPTEDSRGTNISARFIPTCILLFIGIVLSVSAAITPYLPGDLLITGWVQSLATPWIDRTIVAVSSLSDTPAAITTTVLIAIALWIRGQWRKGVAFLGMMILEAFLQLLKLLIGRPRPSVELVTILELSSTSSFPSGHTYHAVVFGGLVLALLVVAIQHSWVRRIVIAIVGCWILVSGVSRVYLGVHWPSDVLGSVVLGIPSVTLLTHLGRRSREV